MPEVGAALAIHYFPSFHAIAKVFYQSYRVRIDGGKETGPAGAGIEFRIGAEDGLKGGGGIIGPFLVEMVVFSGKGAFGACLPEDIILVRGQTGLPFGVGQGHGIFGLCRDHLGVGIFLMGGLGAGAEGGQGNGEGEEECVFHVLCLFIINEKEGE